MKIPQMFYLRKMTMGRKGRQVTIYVYWNYRKTICGSIPNVGRRGAKMRILALHPEAEFYR